MNPETWAVSKSDLFMKDPTGRDADSIAYGSTLSNDRQAGKRFDYLIANPPYGKDWKRDEDAVRAEHERGSTGRFGPGLPRISDGQLLFLLHMLAHAKDAKEGGSRIAIIMNGSPLFTGDAGSGESEIRRYILEHDLLEALVALPEQLFYNTGIATYVWVVTNRKAAARGGRVQLIDATSFWVPMRKSLGDKRREIPLERALDILKILGDFKDGDVRKVAKNGKEEEVVVSRIYPTTHFGFRKITVERPLRLNFQASTERIARLEEERGFQALAQSKKKGAAGAKEQAEGRAQQEEIRKLLRTLPGTLFKDRDEFAGALDIAARNAGIKLAAPVAKAVLAALSERDETAAVCRDKDGRLEPDPELRDTESVPLSESVETFFAREVTPHVPDAWIDTDRRDARDGQVGIVGYEINFNRYFYRYTPPRPLEEIEADIRAIETDIVRMLAEVTGSTSSASESGIATCRRSMRDRLLDIKHPSNVACHISSMATGRAAERGDPGGTPPGRAGVLPTRRSLRRGRRPRRAVRRPRRGPVGAGRPRALSPRRRRAARRTPTSRTVYARVPKCHRRACLRRCSVHGHRRPQLPQEVWHRPATRHVSRSRRGLRLRVHPAPPA